jgi:molybdate transport system ATP-binding protein
MPCRARITCGAMSGADRHYLETRLTHANLRRGGRQILRDVSWTICPGEHWVLAGANGAGKTQLLKIVAGLVWPAPAARATLHYRIGRQHSTSAFGIKHEIAYLGAERQDKYQRYGWNTVARRIVGTGLYRTDIPLDAITAADSRRIASLLAALGAAHLAPRPFLSLSYGERRVILLARALAGRPRLLLLDEVLNGLDEINRARIVRWLARRTRALPWVLATHRIEDVPPGATHALVLNRGHIVYAGALRGARLSRWLKERRHDVPRRARSHRPARRRPRALVRLAAAHVYLGGRAALNGISLTVRAGEFWLVHGHNGSGKTTLLRTLYGDHGVAVGGTIRRRGVMAGVPLESFKKRVGLVAPHLQADHPRQLTVAEVVESGRHASIGLNEAPSAADRAAARRALAKFALTKLAMRAFGELSYGQSRRVLFARAWVRRPRLLLLDEPLAGVDAATRRALTRRVLALARDNVAVVVTAHRDNDWVDCATHELELAQGRARYCGPLRPKLARARR